MTSNKSTTKSTTNKSTTNKSTNDKKIEQLLSHSVDVAQNGSSLKDYSSMDSKTSNILEDINSTWEELEQRNPLQEVQEVEEREDEVTVPVFGVVGKVLGLNKVVTENNSYTITKKLNLQQAVPRMLEDLNYLNQGLDKEITNLQSLVETRREYMSEMERECERYTNEYNASKRKLDDVETQRNEALKTISELESYLDESSYRDEEFPKKENQRDNLKRKVEEFDNTKSLLKRDVSAKEHLKENHEKSLRQHMEINRKLEKCIKESQYFQEYVGQIMEESQMNFNSVVGVHKLLYQFGSMVGDVMKINNLNYDMVSAFDKYLSDHDYEQEGKGGVFGFLGV